MIPMRETEEAKKARLAEALRQNLRRRKAQGREMGSDGVKSNDRDAD